MAKHRFEYYLHDDATSTERIDNIGESAEIEISEELAAKIGKPFYEIALDCELDDETGEVTILSAKPAD